MINEWENENSGICRGDKYYSTQCTISKNNIKWEISEEEKKNLITPIKAPSDSCLNVTQLEIKGCSDKIANETGSFVDVLHAYNLTSRVIDCCIKWRAIDCVLDVAKVKFISIKFLELNKLFFHSRKMRNVVTRM